MIEWRPSPAQSVDDIYRDLWRLVDAFVRERPQFATAAELANAAAPINTVGKYEAKAVWDSTNKRVLHASGGGPTDAWYLDGVSTITPS